VREYCANTREKGTEAVINICYHRASVWYWVVPDKYLSKYVKRCDKID
jgi:hypothetical protein